MCLALCSPVGVVVPKENLEEAFKSNDDGAGFAYAENDQLHIEKGFMTFDSFYEAYKPHEEKAAIVHFRIKTHGDVDQDNTHPFQVGKHLAFIHNGVISRVNRDEDKSKSDTYWFNQKLLVPIYKKDSRFIFKDHFKELIQEYIGGSKLVFLNNKGHHTIVNEKAGHWKDGVWYSNHSYEPRKAITPYTPRQSVNSSAFSHGTYVQVRTTKEKGFVEYFGNGLMIGVKMDDSNITRMVHASLLDVVPTNEFEVGDWIVRKDNPDNVGEIVGLLGNRVIVNWLGSNGTFAKPDVFVDPATIDYWWDVNTMEIN